MRRLFASRFGARQLNLATCKMQEVDERLGGVKIPSGVPNSLGIWGGAKFPSRFCMGPGVPAVPHLGMGVPNLGGGGPIPCDTCDNACAL